LFPRPIATTAPGVWPIAIVCSTTATNLQGRRIHANGCRIDPP
jgi:hypothetical protein